MVKNNYSSGRNDDRIANPNGKNEPQEFVDESTEGIHEKDVIPCHSYSAVGNMNLNSMLVENIRSHDYFKGLSELKSFEEVVDQIYYDCKLACLWMPGTHKAQRAAGMCSGLRGVSNAGVPSTAAMILFKLYTLQLTAAQVKVMVNHPDSTYIKVIGFLYLRHVLNPKELWSWCEPCINNTEKFSEMGDDGSTTTLGSFLKRILLDQEYHDSMLPRLPVPVHRDIEKKIQELSSGRGGGSGGDARWESRRDQGRDGGGREERRDDYRRDERAGGGASYRDLDGGSGRSHDERGRDGRGYAAASYSGGSGYGGGYANSAREQERRTDDHRGGRDEPRRDEPRGSGGGHGEPARGRADERGGHYEWPMRADERRPVSYLDERRDEFRRDERREKDAAEHAAKRSRTEQLPPEPAAKVETAAEKLARLRAKQASLSGAGHLGGRVGGDYAGAGNSLAPAKGIQRYQQMMKQGRH